MLALREHVFLLLLLLLLLPFSLTAAPAPGKPCGAPPRYPAAEPRGSYLDRRSYLPGQRVFYSCAVGHTPVGGALSVMCLNGRWTALTLRCERKPCGSAGDILNGYFKYEGDALFGDRAFTVCNEGFWLKGLQFRICRDFGWEGIIGSCERDPPEMTCPSPSVANGVKTSGDSPAYRPRDSVSFVCREGFHLNGTKEITCGPDGQWNPQPPRCLPLTKNCGPPTPYPNMLLVDAHSTQHVFLPKSRVQYKCAPGYFKASGTTSVSECLNGLWTQINMNCERKSCGSAGEILHGHYKYDGILFGDRVTAVCNEGYQLIGRPYRNCLEMGWDGRNPVCEAVQCKEPPKVYGADWFSSRDESFLYGTMISYRCHQGHLIGNADIHCTAGGTWSSKPPKCRDVTCPNLTVKNGDKTSGFGPRYTYRDSVSFRCRDGYVLVGKSKVSCQADGTWGPDVPKCRALKCSTIKVENGYVSYQQMANRQIATIQCKAGFRRQGAGQVTCFQTGRWSAVPATCVRIERGAVQRHRI